ncbi:MAG TPA: AmmeMemoRadiSam system protein A, partial [Prolixibacteraceae bacterium]|nr:AmmeMemoRadiSam system protein A [Prolixibacteraceae bacterium]
FQLKKEEQSELLLLAKEAIGTKLSGGKPSATGHLKKGILGSPAGAFVSVYVKGELRGCIGNFGSTGKTLGEVVQKSAISAINDSRFRPLHKDEQKDMELEISVLSPLKKIESVSEIELGRHGIYIKKGLHSGTFLPQVASKTGWALDEFLGRCSRDKAGLSWDGWKKADLFTYEAFVFRG